MGQIQPQGALIDRKRVLELILAVVCVLFLPGYLVNLYFSRHNAQASSEAPVTDPHFKAAFDAGVALEQGQQYRDAIPKFLESEMYAAKMPKGKYAALETAIEHYRNCNAALGEQDTVRAANKQLIRTLFEEGDSLRNANQLEQSVPKFQQVEEAAEGINDFVFRAVLDANHLNQRLPDERRDRFDDSGADLSFALLARYPCRGRPETPAQAEFQSSPRTLLSLRLTARIVNSR